MLSCYVGTLSIVCVILWCVVVRDTPEQHPWISDQERLYIQRSLGSSTKTQVSGHFTNDDY